MRFWLSSRKHEPDEFWGTVKTNLQACKIRLVFVADVIPPELRRIIEFLNENMDPPEVLGVEVRQFVGEGLKSLVPRVVGQTETALTKKQSGTKREAIGTDDFWLAFRTSLTEEQLRAAERIVEWSRSRGLIDNFKRSSSFVACIPVLRCGERSYYPISMNSRGEVSIQMLWLRKHPPFDNNDAREELRRRLAELPGFKLGEKGMLGFPKVPLESLADPEDGRQFTATLDWMVEQLRRRT